ncbi:MAG TPA: glycosyltransferase family 2 protein [Draconibacterium sp.]|nr:glycosyltransferase family 2 protein [Draconibacterium sp.]
MPKKVNCFIRYSGNAETQTTVDTLISSGLVEKVIVISSDSLKIENAEILVCGNPRSTDTIKRIAEKSTAPFSLLALNEGGLNIGQFALERMFQVIENTEAAMVYADYFEIKNRQVTPHPVIDYQSGSLRDDFNFGPAQLFQGDVLQSFEEEDFQQAGFYALRLHASRVGEIIHIQEFLFGQTETDTRKSGEKQFDYVSGKAREKQLEMEKACTGHLKKIGAFLKPPFKEVDFGEQDFPVEASVIIPVKNRIKTINDAVRSVLKQKTTFSFNLIVVDNHSTDGTSKFLAKYAESEELIHVVPTRKDLGIGGCWNEGIFHESCGKFAVQLDSDDIYTNENTLQKIVDKFYDENCAMVIGSYRMTNFKLEEIPPGIIDHSEWTPENGPNNALRINGLGAPRAFYTPVLREIRVPNVSYGEDYAVGLAISREYKIGRIYEPLYLCRRWKDNTDASLDINKLNAHNFYKDRIRTIELKARMKKADSNQ